MPEPVEPVVPTYTVACICTNCFNEITITRPIGVKLNESHTGDNKCPKCGCQGTFAPNKKTA